LRWERKQHEKLFLVRLPFLSSALYTRRDLRQHKYLIKNSISLELLAFIIVACLVVVDVIAAAA